MGRHGCVEISGSMEPGVIQALAKVEGYHLETITFDDNHDALYGVYNEETKEWKDGTFTALFRKMIAADCNTLKIVNVNGELSPYNVEPLNSLLDDNKVLCLANGERLELPSNMKLVFQVKNMDNLSPAFVSRTGNVYC